MKSGQVKFKAELGIDRVIAHLGNLITGLRSGELVVQRDGEHARLHPARGIAFSFKTKQDDEEEGLVLELRWRPRTATGDDEQDFWLGAASTFDARAADRSASRAVAQSDRVPGEAARARPDAR